MRITQSVLGSVDKCLLSAQYTIDRPVWFKHTAGASRAVGTGYHSGLEHIYVCRMEGLPWTLASAIENAELSFDMEMTVDSYDGTPVEVFKWSDEIPDRETASELMRAMLTEYVEGGHVWPENYRVLGVEIPFKVQAGEHELGAKGIDLVLEDPGGWIVLVDHKTARKAWNQGKEHPRKNNQAPFYVAGARHLFPGAPGYRMVFDVMIYPGKKTPARFERRISDPKPEHEAAVLKKAADFAFLFDTVHNKAGMDLPANPASTLCNPKWCDWFDGCPHGAVLE